MPWGIKKSGSKYVVYNKETGRVAGRHATKEQAQKQRTALYINVKEK